MDEVFILVGEDTDTGLIEDVRAYRTEDAMIRGFEELTGYTWEQYLNGEYNYDTAPGYFYRDYAAEVEG